MKKIIDKQLKSFDDKFHWRIHPEDSGKLCACEDIKEFISTAIREAYLKGFVEGLTEQDKIKKKLTDKKYSQKELDKAIKEAVEEAIIKDRKDTCRIVENISDSSSRPKTDVIRQLWRRAYDKNYKN